jgi:hypothetical protein
MSKISIEKFNKGEVTVWFYIDNIRYYDEKKNLIEKDDEYVCFFKFNEPTFMNLGELIKNNDGIVVKCKNANNALNNAINYVKTKFILVD